MRIGLNIEKFLGVGMKFTKFQPQFCVRSMGKGQDQPRSEAAWLGLGQCLVGVGFCSDFHVSYQ